MIDEIASWSPVARAISTICVTAVALVSFALATWFGVRTGDRGRPSPASLVHSGWSMSTRHILRQWGRAEIRRARASYWWDLVASLALGAALLLAAVPLGERADLAALRNTQVAAVWTAIGGTAAAIVLDGCMLRIVGLFRRKGAIAWVAVSIALTAVWLRLLLTAFAVGYVLVASAGLSE